MQSRRQNLRHSAVVLGLLASTGLFPQFAFAFSQEAFDAKSLQGALQALGAAALTESRDVTLTGPEMAANGALVSIAVSTTLPGVRRILILVEKNPVPLIALFNVSSSIEPAFSTRIKMAQSSEVYAVAIMDDGKAMYARKDVRVTLGGCGA